MNFNHSRYFQTTRLLRATAPMDLAGHRVTIRLLSTMEARELQERARKRNVFARHSGERGFYVQRLGELAEQTVIEVVRPGQPDDVLEEARAMAFAVEAAAITSTAFYLTRRELQRNLPASTAPEAGTFNIAIGPDYHFLRSRSRPEEKGGGIKIDDRFVRRFMRLGLPRVVFESARRTRLGERLANSLRWLLESRLETNLDSALVKTAIALEVLLVENKSDPLIRAISERGAFLLSEEPLVRARISRVLKRFYNSRSRTVHGGRRGSISMEALDAVDRVTCLIACVLASNSDQFSGAQPLHAWADSLKWGMASDDLERPFTAAVLLRALKRWESQA